MKKMSLLVLTLLVGLPGCGNKQKKAEENNKVNVEQHVDMFASVEENDTFSPDDLDEDYDNLRTFFDFDDEAEEFVASEDSDLYRNFDFEEDLSDSQQYSWVDAQSDDELKPVYFAFNSFELNKQQKEVLKQDIEQLKELIADAGNESHALIVAEGHTDQEGTPSYNLILSENRAKTVADLLVQAGIDSESIRVVGRGQDVPVVIDGKVVDGTRAERAPNRRVELRVIYT
jgi:outer membrane protein OmpA-like peptidoglycan-associated protein